MRHASFFSGVGGVDIAFERAGWETVSHSEIEKYPSAVLAEHWPDVPNLGDITQIDPNVPAAWHDADLWTGGFPCQDLSNAGKRKGFLGDRSVLAFTFLDLVEAHRPRAILLENVPGLLTSNNGLDFARLLGEMAQLGYGVAYRVLDAQFFGVPQRRRRVFILGLRSDPDDADGSAAAGRAGEVLSVGARCDRHPAKGGKAGKTAAGALAIGLDIAGSLTTRYGKGVNTTADDGGIVVVGGAPADAGRVREAAGDAGRLDDSQQLASTLQASQGHHGHSSPRGDGSDNLIIAPTLRVGAQRIEDGGPGDTVPVVPVTGFSLRGRAEGNVPEPFEDIAPALRGAEGGSTQPFVTVPFVKAGRAQDPEAGETWVAGDVMPTLNAFDVGDTRTTAAIVTQVGALRSPSGGWRPEAEENPPMAVGYSGSEDDPLLPDGLDSNRYRAIGNAVAVPVVEWIAHRLTHELEDDIPWV